MALQEPISVNPFAMKKAELLEFFTGRCRHHHLYCEHPKCWLDEKQRRPRIGILDIETTGFEADYHHILSYVIKTYGEKEYAMGVITKEEIDSHEFDKRLCKDLIDDLLKYDVILTYNGTTFDIPFIRSRCLKHKLDFPVFGVVKHKDVYYMVRRLLRLHRSSLDAATTFLGIKGKNHVLGDHWMRARVGDRESLEYVLNHNIRDCDILERLYNKLKAYDKGLAKAF